MISMYWVRRKCPPSQLRPELRFIRTLQSPHHLVKDEQTGRYRISSKAFGPSSSDGKLSGDLEQILVQDGLSATAMYPAVLDAVGAAAISVGQIRAAKATVDHDPVRFNWYHGSVIGSKKRSVKKSLEAACVEIVEIDQAAAARLDAMWRATHI